MICDFCSDPFPQWSYPAKDFQVTEVSMSKGGWAACNLCHLFIEREQWKDLYKHSIATFKLHYGFALPPEAQDMLRGLQQNFRQNRTGPAVPIEYNDAEEISHDNYNSAS